MSNPVEYIKILADLVQTELDLKPDQVWLYNQEVPIPPTAGMFINVGFLGRKVFGARNAYDGAGSGLVQYQSINTQETYSILVYSKDSTARQRCHEVIFALNGDAAQQAQEKYSFKIGYLPPSFVDISEQEGTARLNRYSLAFNILCAYSRRRSTEFFDTFPGPSLVINP